MSFIIHRKRYLFHLLCLTGLFSLAIVLQEKYPFEDGIYTQFTLSMLEDGDFNVINQVKDSSQNWLATQTGNHSNFHHPAVAVYLFPFIAYQKIFATSASPTEAHMLATLFYLMLALLLLKQLLDHWGLNYSKQAIGILALSTPFIWFSLMASVGSNIFSLVFSVFVLIGFCFNPHKYSTLGYGFLGIALGLGFAIRIQQFWIFSLFLFSLLMDRERSFKKTFLFILGSLLPLTLLSCNLYLRSGSFFHPHHVYTSWTKLGEFWNSTLLYALIGPNGYFTLFPIYLFMLLFGICLLFTQFKEKKLYLFLITPPTLLFLYYSLQWPLMDSLTGRHQLDYFFIFSFIVAAALERAKKNRITSYVLWTIITLSILWSIRTHIAYFIVDHTQWEEWQFTYFVAPQYFMEQVTGFSQFLNPLSHLWAVIKFLPLIVLLSYITHLVEAFSEKQSLKFSYMAVMGGFVFYVIFTQLNIFNNSRHVRDYAQQGIYKNKVITAGNAATVYDDFIETHHKALRWSLMQKDCKTVKRLIEIKEEYLKVVKTEVIYDPIGMVPALDENKLKKSYLEGQDLGGLKALLLSTCPATNEMD